MPTWCCLVRPPCAHTLPPGCRRKSPPGLPAGWRSRLLSTSTPLDLGLTVNIPAGVDQQAGTWRACPLQRPPQMFLGQLLASLNSVLRKSKAQKSKRELTSLFFDSFSYPILLYLILFCNILFYSMGFPGGSSGKGSAYQCRRPGFNPWVRKILWRRK